MVFPETFVAPGTRTVNCLYHLGDKTYDLKKTFKDRAPLKFLIDQRF